MSHYPELETDFSTSEENHALIMEGLEAEGVHDPQDFFERNFEGIVPSWEGYVKAILEDVFASCGDNKSINLMMGYFDFGKFTADLSHDFIVIDLGLRQGVAIFRHA